MLKDGWHLLFALGVLISFLVTGYTPMKSAFWGILALVGAVNLPIIKYSVDWLKTLHQPASVVRLDGPAIHPTMLWPLLLMAIGFTFFFVTVLILRVRGEIAAAKIRNLQLSLAQG